MRRVTSTAISWIRQAGIRILLSTDSLIWPAYSIKREHQAITTMLSLLTAVTSIWVLLYRTLPRVRLSVRLLITWDTMRLLSATMNSTGTSILTQQTCLQRFLHMNSEVIQATLVSRYWRQLFITPQMTEELS